jgi:hypothetical protein
MTTPVFGDMPTLDRSAIQTPSDLVQKVEIPISEPPQLQTLHIFQRLLFLRNRFDLRDPYWTEVITAQEYIAAAEHYGFDRATARALRVNGKSYGSVMKDGALERMLLFLMDYDTVDVTPGKDRRSLDTADPIIVGELHCPYVDGATATFENKTEGGTEIGVEVTAAGLGGGGWTTAKLFSSGTKFSIEARNCKLLYAHLRGHYVIWMPVDESSKKEPIVLVNVTGIHELYTDALDDDEYHLCSKADSFDRFVTELSSGYSVAKNEMKDVKLPITGGESGPREVFDEWETSRTYEGRWGSEIPLGDATLDVGVTYSSHFIHTIRVTETLPYGYRYIGKYRSTRELPQQWAARALTAQASRSR